jgi:hypothetical protein
MSTNLSTPLDLTDLQAQVAGPVLAEGDPALMTEAAPFNVAHVLRPVAAVVATGPADVAAAVRWAAARDLPVAVQATGHGLFSDLAGHVLVCTHRMSWVEVDPQASTARVGAGTRWKDVIDAAAPHGLAPLNGSTSHVGVVGYTLGGGHGVLARKYGFAADHVRWIELVTADGQVVEVTAESDPDLFWALRGGKGNFGIVTAMEFDLVPVARLYGGGLFYPAEVAPELMRRWAAWAPGLPEDASTSVALIRMPPMPELPPPLQGRTVVHLRFAHQGTVEEGQVLLGPLTDGLGDPIIGGIGEMPYAAVDSIHMDPTDPMPAMERGLLLSELTLETIDAFLGQVGPDAETPLLMAELRLMGGACARQPQVPNAVAGRTGAYTLFMAGIMAGPAAEAVVPAMDALVGALEPWSSGRSLLNFLGPAGPERVVQLWDPEDLERLRAVKQRVDPDRVFRSGHLIA